MRKIISMIPNTITIMNLLCGCMAVLHAFSGDLETSFILVIAAAVFDFLDGFAARLLKAYSDIGKELDSLADMVSFGLAPSAVAYTMGAEHLAFIIAAFSALRLAKFNIDTRQTTEFIGLPTPANALLFTSMGWIAATESSSVLASVFTNQWVLISLIVVFSLLLVSEIRMFSLKFKSYKFRDNCVVYSFLMASLAAIICFWVSSLPFIIVCYVLISVVAHFGRKRAD